MPILVAKLPHRRYQTIGGLGLLSQADIAQADRLDEFLAQRLDELRKTLMASGHMPKQKGKGSLTAYWELGRAIRDVAETEAFPNMAELPLLWQNVKMHLDDVLLYKDRGPRREHLWYCFRLAGYPQELARRMKWGEWVTMFDSPGINQEARFDDWFQRRLQSLIGDCDRAHIRLFAPCINAMLGNIDLPALSDAELHRCYSAGWELANRWRSQIGQGAPGALPAKEIRTAVEAKIARLDDVMGGELTPQEFAQIVAGD